MVIKRPVLSGLLVLAFAGAANAGVLVSVPSGSFGERSFSRVTTAPLRATNPDLSVRYNTSDVSYYYSFKRAENDYNRELARWEQQRYQTLERRRKEEQAEI